MVYGRAVVALLAASVQACSPSAPPADAPSTPGQRQAATPTSVAASEAPEVPAFVSALAANPLPGKWSLVRNEGLVHAWFSAARSSKGLAAVSCLEPQQRVEFLFAPPSSGPLRVPGDPRLITLSVITATERLDLTAVDWSQSSGRFELRAAIDGRSSSLRAMAMPQERIALGTDYFEAEIELVFPWHQSIATVLEECSG